MNNEEDLLRKCRNGQKDAFYQLVHPNEDTFKVTRLGKDPESGFIKVNMQYMFDGFKEVPKELKLTLVQASVTYKDVNWSAPIN